MRLDPGTSDPMSTRRGQRSANGMGWRGEVTCSPVWKETLQRRDTWQLSSTKKESPGRGPQAVRQSFFIILLVCAVITCLPHKEVSLVQHVKQCPSSAGSQEQGPAWRTRWREGRAGAHDALGSWHGR